jgi:hypothetical protein
VTGIPTEYFPPKDVGIPSTYCNVLLYVSIGEHIIENHNYGILEYKVLEISL